jgi:hypothetical protein
VSIERQRALPIPSLAERLTVAGIAAGCVARRSHDQIGAESSRVLIDPGDDVGVGLESERDSQCPNRSLITFGGMPAFSRAPA